jgi:outer membrane immunogenic protein
MSRLLAFAIAVCSVAVSPALAADLPPPAPPPRAPAAYIPPPPVFTWTGFYVGINGGYGWSNWSDTFGNTASGNGFLAGGQLGVNYQLGQFVFGFDADIDWSGVKWSQSAGAAGTFFGAPAGGTASATNKEDVVSTFTGRFGFAVDRALIYAKFGGAWTEEKWTLAAAGVVGAIPFSLAGTPSSDRLGWTAGGGFEYAVLDNFTVRAEYDFLDFRTLNETLTMTGGGITVTGVVPSKLTMSQFKVGLNYLFH